MKGAEGLNTPYDAKQQGYCDQTGLGSLPEGVMYFQLAWHNRGE